MPGMPTPTVPCSPTVCSISATISSIARSEPS
jgi:hypothetical protein